MVLQKPPDERGFCCVNPTINDLQDQSVVVRYVPELDGGGGPWFRLAAAFAAGSNLAGVVAMFSKDTCRGMSEVIEAMDAPLAQVLDDLGLPRLAPEDSFWYGQILPLSQRRLRRAERPAGSGSDNFFERVKAGVAIEDFAARFTDLTSSGGHLKGLCPLHEERTPSFVVWPESGRWRCFGRCAEGGDVINLAQGLMDRGLM